MDNCIESGEAGLQGEAKRPHCQFPPDCRTKISELRVRTGEGGGQKGLGLREEGHRAGSQGVWLQQPAVPVQTHPGSVHTHRRLWPNGVRDPCRHALTCTHTCAHTQGHAHTTAGALMNTQVHMQPHAPASGLPAPCQNTASGWVREADSHLLPSGPSPLCLPTRVKPQGSGPRAEEMGFREGGAALGVRGGWCGSQAGGRPPTL